MIHHIIIVFAATSAVLQPTVSLASTTLSFEYQPQVIEDEAADEVTSISNLTVSPSTWGKKGTWRWDLTGGYGWDVKTSENKLTTYGVEFEYFVEDNLSLDIGLLGIDVDQRGKNVDGLNFTLQLRWHFATKETWSLFMEGGAGLLRTSDNVPAGGSKFNFTPQAGLGASFDIGNNNRWLIGVRWHHISNANTYDTNPGRDSIMVWTGLSFPF
ncbi:MAG: acyloxyacyl hydrolase [Phycisphaerales bacterium]|nr:acyloxyacyl hydrolase [Phycisphaerales bacterium]